MLNNEHQSFPIDSVNDEDGNLVLVLLNKGPVLARYVRELNGEFEIELPNKNRAQLPPDRFLQSIVMDFQSTEQLKTLNKDLRSLANKMNLHETWDKVKDSDQQLSSEQIAHIYFGHPPSGRELTALVMHLETSCIYFDRKESVYCPAHPLQIEKKLSDKTSREEKKQLVESLAKSLQEGILPVPLTIEHETILKHLRGFAIHGNNYPDYKTALDVMRLIETGSKNRQKKAWELLAVVNFIADDEPIELEREDIQTHFSTDTSAEVKLIQGLDLLKLKKEDRRDLTKTFTITVDNKDTRDRDDAISIEIQEPGVVLLGVHITDVGSIIEKDSLIDLEAKSRSTSIYLPDLAINMLPDTLSEGIFSLRQGETSLALSVMAKFVSSQLDEWEIFTSYIKPNEVMTYEQVDRVLSNPQEQHHLELTAFDDITKSLRASRRERGAIVLNRPSLDITVGPDNFVSVDVINTDTPGRVAIAEAMVLANSLLAKLCTQIDIPTIYRAQEKTDAEAYEIFLPNSLDALGQYELMRKLPPAYMTTVNNKHSGLGLDHYVQATAPIRRFCDLVIQRQISHTLKYEKNLYSADELENIVQCSTAKLKRASAVTNERKRYWFLKWLESRMDDGFDEYQAVVLVANSQGFGILEMAEFPFRFKAKLSDFDRPGDIISVRLSLIDMWSRTPKFNVIP